MLVRKEYKVYAPITDCGFIIHKSLEVTTLNGLLYVRIDTDTIGNLYKENQMKINNMGVCFD